jgi:hypothetical protein
MQYCRIVQRTGFPEVKMKVRALLQTASLQRMPTHAAGPVMGTQHHGQTCRRLVSLGIVLACCFLRIHLYTGVLTMCWHVHPSALLLQEFKIQNIVGSCDVKFPIRLEGLCIAHGYFATVRRRTPAGTACAGAAEGLCMQGDGWRAGLS